jgi:hypothetical protein
MTGMDSTSVDEIVWRRFGSSHEKPCKRPSTITCAMWECQKANECQWNFATGERKKAPMIVKAEKEPILQFFGYTHLPETLQPVSQPFCELAEKIVSTLPRNPERTVALRKLLEAKDAAVRAALSK